MPSSAAAAAGKAAAKTAAKVAAKAAAPAAAPAAAAASAAAAGATKTAAKATAAAGATKAATSGLPEQASTKAVMKFGYDTYAVAKQFVDDNVVAKFLAFEQSLIAQTGWPDWATRSLFALALLGVIVLLITTILEMKQQMADKKEKKSKKGAQMDSKKMWEFRKFQAEYLSVYLIIMLADWLQGTNMYTLYAGYGVDIGALFSTGFLASAVVGTFVGIYVDKWGRRAGCVLFCVLEVIINSLEHVNNFPLLILGRILGGITTSLLFSAFESWMVTEHRKRSTKWFFLQLENTALN